MNRKINWPKQTVRNPCEDFVMLGGMFAGHDESGGDVVVRADGSLYKSFYGMSSSVVRTLNRFWVGSS
jgi:IMP dehydrogenase/GMP reductase